MSDRESMFVPGQEEEKRGQGRGDAAGNIASQVSHPATADRDANTDRRRRRRMSHSSVRLASPFICERACSSRLGGVRAISSPGKRETEWARRWSDYCRLSQYCPCPCAPRPARKRNGTRSLKRRRGPVALAHWPQRAATRRTRWKLLCACVFLLLRAAQDTPQPSSHPPMTCSGDARRLDLSHASFPLLPRSSL